MKVEELQKAIVLSPEAIEDLVVSLEFNDKELLDYIYKNMSEDIKNGSEEDKIAFIYGSIYKSGYLRALLEVNDSLEYTFNRLKDLELDNLNIHLNYKNDEQ